MTARVLIAHSVPAVAWRIKARFAPGQFQLARAETGRDALRIIGEWRPDVVLLAVTMPDMQGIEVCRQIKADPAAGAVFVVMVTGSGESDQELRALEAGADDFLGEPGELAFAPRRLGGLVRFKRVRDEWQAREETARELALAREPGSAPSLLGACALVIDEDEPEAKLAREWLARDGIRASLESGADAPRPAAAVGAFDLVILSHAVGSRQPERLPGWLRTTDGRCIALLVISGCGGSESGFGGGNDRVLRPIAEARFRARARNQILHWRYQARLSGGEKAPGRSTDAPSGIFDERYTRHHMLRLLAGDPRRDLAALRIEVDQLRRITESYGRTSGGHALAAVASTLRGNLRVFDTLARYGDDGFLVLMPGTTLAEAVAAGERLRDAVAVAPCPTRGEGVAPRLTVSMGIAAGTGASSSAEALLQRAESALRSAKRFGWNRVESAESAPSPLREGQLYDGTR